MNSILKNPNSNLFKFCPGCGKQNLAALDKKSFQCSDCGFKFYLNCAAAVIALIFSPDNQLLVTKRKYDPAKGSLDFPGGFANPGETIEECAIREVKEELNLDVLKLTYVCSVPNTYLFRDITYDITDFVFTCLVKNFDNIQSADDISAFKFFNIEQLKKDLFGLDSPKKVIDLLQYEYRAV